MSIKTARKIGFFAALTILVGSVVGIGIFFKNGSVLGSTEGSGATALTAWIVGGLLALFAAISFSEIGAKLKTKNIHGLPAWAEINGGKKFGYFVRFNFFVFYFGILFSVIGFFVSELFFVMLETMKEGGDWQKGLGNMPKPWVHALIGIAFAVTAAVSNIISIKVSSKAQVVITILKFVPLLLALIVGIAFPNTHNNNGSNQFTNGQHFTFTGLLAALPGILFAYDAFLGVASLPEKTKGGVKTVSKVVLLGLILVVALYSLIAVSSMLHGGRIDLVITDSLPSGAANGLNIFVFTFLFISGYGVLNGFAPVLIAYTEQNLKSNTLFGSKFLKNKIGEKSKYIVLIFITIFGWIIGVLPAAILGTDQYVDASSNFPVLFFFGIYAITIFLFIIKNDDHSMLSKIAGWAFVAGVTFVVLYQIFYGFTIKFWTTDTFGKDQAGLPVPYDWTSNSSTGIGLFAPRSHEFADLDFFIMFISFVILFAGLPYLNEFLKRKFENESAQIDTQNIKSL